MEEKTMFENQSCEFKEKINDTLVKEIEAFLNSDGGNIYIGIKDDGTVIGVENVDKCLKEISDIITDQIVPNCINFVKPVARLEDNKIIVDIQIRKGTANLYYIKKYGISVNGCHIRVGSTCKSMTTEMIKYRLTLDYIDNDVMIKTPSYYGNISFNTLKIYFSEKGYHLDDNSFETNLSLKTLDDRYNLLAELVSDTNNIPFIFVKFNGLDKVSMSERNDYGFKSILIAYQSLKNRLIAENICKVDTTVRPRKETYLYDIDVINEALLNALIHNDYLSSHPIISMFDNRLEILSHGGIPKGLTIEEFYEGISKPRNMALMNIFSKLGIAEHTGHGMPTIIKKYGKECIDIHDTYIKVTIPFNKEGLLNRGATSGAINGAINNLNESEKKVISSIADNNYITIDEISNETKIPKRTVQRLISTLRKNSIIERRGSNKTGYWQIII